MPNCIDCVNIVSTNCIRSEEELSFKYDDFNNLLKQLDEKSVLLKNILSTNIDKKWIKSNNVYITDYIQDIINKIDVIISTTSKTEEKFKISSDITGTDEKSLLQLLTIYAKEISDLKKRLNSNTSSLYVPNV